MIVVVLSWFFVAFGHIAFLGSLGPWVMGGGYAWLWAWLYRWPSKKRFFVASIWFGGVQAVQLSWLLATEYVGALIVFVYLGIIAGLGVGFGFFSQFVVSSLGAPRLVLRAASLASIWVFFEWMQLLPCTGFPWNPLGLSWTSSRLALQAVSLFGLYGLSFWAMFINVLFWFAWVLRKKGIALFTWGCWILPFLYGAIHLSRQEVQVEKLSAVLVQTGLLPHELGSVPVAQEKKVAPLDQFRSLLLLLQSQEIQQVDLIVFPEGTVPFLAYDPVYPWEVCASIWQECFGAEAKVDLPVLGDRTSKQKSGRLFVNNLYWFQAIANHYRSEVIVGLNDQDEESVYNAAFHLLPTRQKIDRYEKRILVLGGEYIPLGDWKWLSKIVFDRYGIASSFAAGKKEGLFEGRWPLGINICCEEAYSHIARESRLLGARCLVNLSNDGWFPHSRLPQQQLALGIVRAVENGVPLLHVAHTGVTGGVDATGKVLKTCSLKGGSALQLEIPLHSFSTLYTRIGDQGIFWISLFFVLIYFLELFEIREFSNLSKNYKFFRKVFWRSTPKKHYNDPS